MSLDFALFDADNHYYEAPDAFTRHLDPAFRRRGVQWATLDGKPRLLVGGRICRFIPNPRFDPIARPGSLDEYFRGKQPSNDIRAAFGDLDALADHPEYQNRDARLKVMDDQGVEGAFMFPTQGVGMEEALVHDVPALCATFEAFNRWMDDDWGYAYENRIFAAPMITLADVDWAEREVRRVAAAGARIVCLRAGPVRTEAGGRSPGSPQFDRFWSAVEETGVLVGFHAGDAGYSRYADDWGAGGDMQAFRFDPFAQLLAADRPMVDTIGALITHRMFERHPRVRVVSVENGAGWVTDLLKRLAKFYKQVPDAFAEDPRETFNRHVWVAPFYEDDIRELADRIGVSHVLMGSDWPHAEGLRQPADFANDLHGFDERETRMIMRDNAWALLA